MFLATFILLLVIGTESILWLGYAYLTALVHYSPTILLPILKYHAIANLLHFLIVLPSARPTIYTAKLARIKLWYVRGSFENKYCSFEPSFRKLAPKINSQNGPRSVGNVIVQLTV